MKQLVVIKLSWFFSFPNRFDRQSECRSELLSGNLQQLMGNVILVSDLSRECTEGSVSVAVSH